MSAERRRAFAVRAFAAVRAEPPVGIKRAGEIAHLVSLILLRDAAGLCTEAEARALLDGAWRAIDGGDALIDAIGDGAVAAAYLPFWRVGVRNRHVEQALAKVAATGGSLPMPAASALVQMGLGRPSVAAEAAGRLWLSSELDAWEITEARAYEVTHAVEPLQAVGLFTPEHERRVAIWLPVWIRYFAHAGHLDLLGELLIVAGCVATRGDDADWDVLVGARDVGIHTAIVSVMAWLLDVTLR